MRALTLLPSLILIVSTGPLFAQTETKDRIADLNHDGIIDTLVFASDYGHLATFTDGRSGEKASVPQEEYCRCQVRRTILLPDLLWRPENADVLTAIKAELLPKERATPDASFAWIFCGLDSRRTLSKHGYFDIVIDPGVDWQPGPIALPDTYSLPVNGGELKRLANGVYPAEEITENGFAIYYGHNHYQNRDPGADSLEQVATANGLPIYRTSHGLVIQSATQHHWLFVTDHILTGAPDKLRWPSIGDVAIWQDRLLVLQHRLPVSGGTAIFLIDLDTGRTARLRSDLMGEPDDRISFMLKGDSLAFKTTTPGDVEKAEVDLVLSLEKVVKILVGL